MNLDLNGHWVSRISFENAVLVETLEGDRLRLGCRFSVRSEGLRFDFEDASNVSTGSDHVLLLLQKSIVSASVDSSGALSVELEGSLALEVPPDVSFEAWELDLRGSPSKIVCMPGGRLAIWD